MERKTGGEKRGLQNLRQDPHMCGTGSGKVAESWIRAVGKAACPGQVVTEGAGWGWQLCLLTGEKGRSPAAVVH